MVRAANRPHHAPHNLHKLSFHMTKIDLSQEHSARLFSVSWLGQTGVDRDLGTGGDGMSP